MVIRLCSGHIQYDRRGRVRSTTNKFLGAITFVARVRLKKVATCQIQGSGLRRGEAGIVQNQLTYINYGFGMKKQLFIKTVVQKFISPILRTFTCLMMESLYGLFRSSVAVIVLVYFYIYVHCTNILFLKSHAVLITKNYACIYTQQAVFFSVYLQCIPLLHSCV